MDKMTREGRIVDQLAQCNLLLLSNMYHVTKTKCKHICIELEHMASHCSQILAELGMPNLISFNLL